jgi:hypothetical protein
MHPSPGGRSGLGNSSAMFGGDTPLVQLEGRLGRNLAIVRIYDEIGESFNNSIVDHFMASGSTLLVSLDTPMHGPTYASIASGRYDATISSFLRQMNQAAVTYHLRAIYVDFEHEADVPENHVGLGTPAEFVQAWDHIHHLATAAGLDWNQGGRLHWVLIFTHTAYFPVHNNPNWPGASAFWPGSSEVDIVGVDGYNAVNCRHARPGSDYVAHGTQMLTPAELFQPTVNFAFAHGDLPVFVAEWASVPYTSPVVQPDFIRQMENFVAGHPEIAGALYWNDHGQGNGCNYELDNRPASLAALAAMGRLPQMQARA